MRIAILHTHLAPYFVNCLRELKSKHAVELLIHAWTPEPNAPFDFQSLETLGTVHYRDESSEPEIYGRLMNFCPDAVLVCGWADNGYVRICKRIRKAGVPVIAGCDTQYSGSWRQRLGSISAPFHIRRAFDVIWASGGRQVNLASFLGFSEDRIWQGYYSCDWERFEAVRSTRVSNRAFLYVGRYVEDKGTDLLAAAYEQYQREVDDPWPLLVAGKGPHEQLLADAGASLLGFVQPEDLPSLMARAGVFLLPSLFEPWGVVLHEAAAAGMAIICTEKCGAGDHFVKSGENGLLIAAGSVTSLSQAMRRFHEMDGETLRRFGSASHELSKQYTPHLWVDTFMRGVTTIKKAGPRQSR